MQQHPQNKVVNDFPVLLRDEMKWGEYYRKQKKIIPKS